jgi:hypothetical protein
VPVLIGTFMMCYVREGNNLQKRTEHAILVLKIQGSAVEEKGLDTCA